ncbi:MULTISPECIES: hypothetical protein [unclassified Erythrobacter]|nr:MULTISPECIES: hypothetical protein [unclassified Erythrobacter]
MSKARTLTRRIEAHTREIARVAIVAGCALALVLAGNPLPF